MHDALADRSGVKYDPYTPEEQAIIAAQCRRYADADEARAAFEDYAGEYKSLEDFACDFTEQTGVTIPDSLALYIDYEAMGRDIELNGDVFTIETGFEEVHIFWAR